eukprot:CAMPEP_0119039412 /NCGR_PEP_ID=MMETSP1177-20130426/8873_1 /TAXON_ID=2985 /ORGANISM="Ochromonas sp, Strain CCMP1899" /LENGTH=582 /DNA_ID=CAMNT_0007003233 /DNA_START=119 /DNA_END=1864 /DNA_ORIENTATION=-
MTHRLFGIVSYMLILSQTTSFSGWIDPDTIFDHKTMVSYTDGKTYDLVMSDEFNREGRSFKDGDDPMWTAIDKSDDDQTAQGRGSLQFYNASQVTTENGFLVIKTTTEDTKWKGFNPYKNQKEEMSRHFKSGMVQSWNKFCFTGGIFEVDIQFPGRHDVGGLWPAIWLLGNLGRATFESSTNLMWPWSYGDCDRSMQSAQEISGCDVTQHYSLISGKGRGATEIDLVEVMPGPDSKLPMLKNNVHRPYSSMTLQLAPGIPASQHRPFAGTLPEWGFTWYKNLTYGANTSINPFFYGTYLAATKASDPIGRSTKESYQCDALSSMMTLNETYFNSPKRFRLEWQPGSDGYIHWYVDGEFRFGVEGEGITAFGAKIPDEPSYMIMNTAISTSWGFPNPPFGCNEYDCKTTEGQCGFNPGFCKSLPAKFLIDNVRVYQNKDDPRQNIGCNPKDRPTRKFIKAKEYRYSIPTRAHALFPLNVGGEKCADSKECGSGYCSFMRCRCHAGYMGPRCLVPQYKDDFPDWETDSWLSSFSTPYVPAFLAFGAISLIILLVVAAIVIVRSRKSRIVGITEYEKDGDTSPTW